MQKVTTATIKKVLEWQYSSGNTGLSSECMAAVLCGIKTTNKNHPRDPSDFNRCLGLLDAVPELRSRIKLMKKVSKEWCSLVDKWGSIEECFINEVGARWELKDKRATVTYYAMKGIGL